MIFVRMDYYVLTHLTGVGTLARGIAEVEKAMGHRG